MKPASSFIIPGILPLLSLVLLTGCNPCQETLDKQKATHQLTLEQQSSQHQSVLTEKESHINDLNQQIDTYKAEQSKLQSHIAEQKKELQDRQSKIDKQQQELQNKQTQIKTQEKELQDKQAHINTQEQELQKRQAQIAQHEQELNNRQNNIKQQTEKLLKQKAALTQSHKKADNLAVHLNKTKQQDLLHVQQIASQKQEIDKRIQLEKELTQAGLFLEQKLLEESIKFKQSIDANHALDAELQKQKQRHLETLQQKAELEQTLSNLEKTLDATQEALVNRGMQLAQQEQKIAMAQTDVKQILQTLTENNALLAAKNDLIHGLQMRLSEVTINKGNNQQGSINIPSIYAASDPKVKAEVNALFSRLAIAQDKQIELSQQLIHTKEKLADTQNKLNTSIKQYKTLQHESNTALKQAAVELLASEEALADVTQKLQEQLTLSQELEIITQEQQNKIESLNSELSTASTQAKQLAEELASVKQELEKQLSVSQELELVTQEQQKRIQAQEAERDLAIENINKLTEEQKQTEIQLTASEEALTNVKQELNEQITQSQELELITQQQQQRIQALEADRDLAIKKIKHLTKELKLAEKQLTTSEEALNKEKQELKKQLAAFKELALISQQQQQQLQSLAEEHKAAEAKAHELTGELYHANKKLALYEQNVLDIAHELNHQLTVSEKLEATSQLQEETIQTLEVKLSEEEQALYSIKQELQEQLSVYQESELITLEQQKRIQLLEAQLTTAEAQVYQINDELKQTETQLIEDKQALDQANQELLDLQEQQDSLEAKALEEEARAKEAAREAEKAEEAARVAEAKAKAKAEAEKNKEIIHIVKSGDTLAKIAIEYYDNVKLYKLIQKANNMDNPNTIELGQKLLIPPKP